MSEPVLDLDSQPVEEPLDTAVPIQTPGPIIAELDSDAEVIAPAPEITGSSPWDMFKASLGEEYQGSTVLQNVKDQNDFLEQVTNLSKAVGKKAGIRPPEEGNEQDLHRYWNETGRPEDVSGYDLPEAPEGLQIDNGMVEQMRDFMHSEGGQKGLVEKTIAKFYEVQAAMQNQGANGIIEQRTTAENELRQKFGQQYEQKRQDVVNFVNTVVPEEANDIQGIVLQDGSILGNDPRFFRMVNAIVEKTGEGNFIGAASSSNSNTPAQAQSEIEKLQRSEAYLQGSHEGHAAAVDKMVKLHKELPADPYRSEYVFTTAGD